MPNQKKKNGSCTTESLNVDFHKAISEAPWTLNKAGLDIHHDWYEAVSRKLKQKTTELTLLAAGALNSSCRSYLSSLLLISARYDW